jgi:hypothetical protein
MWSARELQGPNASADSSSNSLRAGRPRRRFSRVAPGSSRRKTHTGQQYAAPWLVASERWHADPLWVFILPVQGHRRAQRGSTDCPSTYNKFLYMGTRSGTCMRFAHSSHLAALSRQYLASDNDVPPLNSIRFPSCFGARAGNTAMQIGGPVALRGRLDPKKQD